MRSFSKNLAVLLAASLAGCANPAAHPPPSLARFHFPTGLAVDVPYALGQDAGTRARWLYVAGNSNFDLAANRGVLMAIDLDRYGAPETGLVPPPLAADAGWDGTALALPDVADAGSMDPSVGWVYTDSLAGELQLADTSAGGKRIVLATREENRLGFIDADGGALSCFGASGQDCLNDTSSPALDVPGPTGANQVLDVFAVSPPVRAIIPDGGFAGPEVFVGHLRDETTGLFAQFGYGAGGYGGGYGGYGYGGYGSGYSPYGLAPPVVMAQSYVIRQSVDDPSCRLAEPIGQTPAAGVVALPGPSGLYAVYTGRAQGMAPASVDYLPLGPPNCGVPAGAEVPVDAVPPSPVVIDLSNISKEYDARGIALSTHGDRIFAISQSPDSVVVLRIDGKGPGSLNLHPSNIVAVPPGPSELLPLPRVGPTGQPIGDLVAVTCPLADVVAFYDDEVESLTAALPVGDEPFALVSAPRTLGTGASAQTLPGIRIFVTAFGSGQIDVIDLPDPLDASSARLVATLGSFEDTTASPINPNSMLLSLPYGYGAMPGGI